MVAAFTHSFQSELLKSKRTVAFWTVVAGAFFTPAIVTLIRLINYDTLPKVYSSPEFWTIHWRNSWESMAMFLLPLGVILIISLLTQLEYRNNTWKQLHTLPLSFTTIFISKLAFITMMVILYLLLFNVGIYVSAIIPYLVVRGVPYPQGAFPLQYFLQQDLYYFVDCLPIVGLQYLLCLVTRNFIVPMGIGFMFWIASLASLSWKYGFVAPYTYGMYTYLSSGVVNKAIIPDMNVHLIALGYFVVFISLSYVLYLKKHDKG